MDRKKITSRDLLSFILAAAALAIMVFLVVTQANNLSTLRQQLSDEEQALEQAEAELASLYEIREEAPLLQEQLAYYNEKIPGEPGESRLLSYLQSLGDDYMESLSWVGYEERQPHDEYEYAEMPVRLNFEGDYHSLLDLLGEMSARDRLLRIDNISITHTGEAGSVLEVDISASAFYREE